MGLAFWLWPRTPPKPADPLSMISVADVVAASLDGASIPHGSPGFRLAAALPAGIAASRPAARPVDWVDVRAVRLALRDGVVLWIQLMPDATGGWARVTADAAGGAEAAKRAKAIRNRRLRAYHLPDTAFRAILASSPESRRSTELSTKNKERISNNKDR